jgi:hypothetical protein
MHNKTLMLVALVPAAGVALYAWPDRSSLPLHEQVARADGSTQLAAHVTATSAAEPTPARSVEALVATHAAPTKVTFADVYAAAENNLVFIRQMYADAQDGDAEAQFQLFSALEYCERYYLFYFVRGNSRRTLDEALAWATRSPGTSAEEAREVHRRCQELVDKHANAFGRSDSWLARAAEGGHPEAQLARAERLLMPSGQTAQDSMQTTNAQHHEDRRTEAKEFLLRGLERKDPSAVWKVGDLQDPLTGRPQEADKDQWVWRLAACKLGYDCSQTAHWYQFMCRFDYNCQPHESGVDLILRASAVGYPDVDRLSDELVEKINKGDLSGLRWR